MTKQAMLTLLDWAGQQTRDTQRAFAVFYAGKSVDTKEQVSATQMANLIDLFEKTLNGN